MGRRVYALSIHADYQCHRSGACCTSDWDVPVELPLYRGLDEALTAGRLRPAARPAAGDAILMRSPDLPDDAAALVARTPGGDCVFYHRDSGLCVIHRDMGASQMPATCLTFRGSRFAIAAERSSP